jgi:hypothetical protein
MRHRPHRPAPEPTREEIAEVLRGLFPDDATPPWPKPKPTEPPAPVPVKLTSQWYWNPFSLFCGLIEEALPQLSGPSWKVVCVIGARQMAAATIGINPSHTPAPIAMSLSELSDATGLSRQTVIAAISAAEKSRLLVREKRNNVRTLYGIDWHAAERAERNRRRNQQRSN